jgi:hypothetical protein
MINQNYFKQINTEEKAYFLGLIYADGNVTGNIFQILLAEEDSEVLEILKNSIKPNSKLYYYDRKNVKWKNCKRFSIHNKEIVKDLQSWGVFERKTYTSLKIPKIDKVLIKHFIRGFLDGDGFISFTESNYKKKNGYTNYSVRKVIGFTNSSKELLEQISDFLVQEININPGKFYNTNGTGSTVNSYSLWFFRNKDLVKLIDYLYADSTIFFNRKYEKSKICMLTPREIRELTGSYPRNA